MRAKIGFAGRRKHKKILQQAKGYRMTRSRLFKPAAEAVMHAGQYAFIGRKLKKRNMRKLWIQRINAAVRKYDLTYSRFIHLAQKTGVEINRKILAHLAATDLKKFKKIIEIVSKKERKTSENYSEKSPKPLG